MLSQANRVNVTSVIFIAASSHRQARSWLSREDRGMGVLRGLQMRKLLVAVTVVIALAVIAVMAAAWKALGQVEVPTAGWVALAAGALLSLAVGTGLTLLMGYSNRAGFD